MGRFSGYHGRGGGYKSIHGQKYKRVCDNVEVCELKDGKQGEFISGADADREAALASGTTDTRPAILRDV